MTFTLLARDPQTNCWGGVAATGNLCVGGWVLRGDARAGICATQGLSPSTLWGEDALAIMREADSAASAIEQLVAPDTGREERQFMAIGRDGIAHAFTGAQNLPVCGEAVGSHAVAGGNMLANENVPTAMLDAYEAAGGPLAGRLLDALRAGVAAGADVRGVQSAAMLIVGPGIAPVSLRIDDSPEPVAALAALHAKTQDPAYAEWLDYVPTRSDPHRRSGLGRSGDTEHSTAGAGGGS